MPITFAKFLEYVRTDRILTQQEMVDLLSSSDPALSKLDLTTFSRWERGVTSPKLSKQLLIARVMEEDVVQLIDPNVKAKEKNKRHFDKMTNRILYPYTVTPSTFSHYHHGSLLKQQGLCEQLSGFHHDYMGISINAEDLQTSELVANTFSDSAGMLVGHLLYGFIPVNQPAAAISPDQLSACPFIGYDNSSEKIADMYVVSTYGSLPAPRMVSILLMLDILCANTQVKHLVLNCHDQEAFALFETSTECEILAKGSEVPFGGIKVFGKNYRYVQLRIKAETILALKVISSLIPFAREYIQSLLGSSGTK
ncbi:helix-turn-helix transcriptional regulator [Aliivibrio logei]|uniref:helix-turn-helix transcriptional regulator n=1 Tax=Aliivibrio logei TaxID=688 RepID=UPI0035C8B617